MAGAFGHKRSGQASDALAASDKVYVKEGVAVARGRFGWAGQVPGAGTLFKHGGVSLMEGLVPWVAMG